MSSLFLAVFNNGTSSEAATVGWKSKMEEDEQQKGEESRRKRRLSVPVQPLPPLTIGSLRDQRIVGAARRKLSCSCTGHCLDMDCPCFGAGGVCSMSSCACCGGCFNLDDSPQRHNAILSVLSAAPFAFRPTTTAPQQQPTFNPIRYSKDDNGHELTAISYCMPLHAASESDDPNRIHDASESDDPNGSVEVAAPAFAAGEAQNHLISSLGKEGNAKELQMNEDQITEKSEQQQNAQNPTAFEPQSQETLFNIQRRRHLRHLLAVARRAEEDARKELGWSRVERLGETEEMAVLAAQDTAIIQETTRMVQRVARAKRQQQQEQKKPPG